MSDKRPNIEIPVDLTNPGQFFACCGLLELADRLWPGAEGAFIAGDKFTIRTECETATPVTLDHLCSTVIKCAFKSLLSDDDRATLKDLSERKACLKQQNKAFPKEQEKERKRLNSKRIAAGFQLGPPFNLRLDWWLADDCDGAHLATWAGQQAISEIAADIKQSLKEVTATELLEHESLIERLAGGAPRAPLSFDAGRVGTAQDIGYSADKIGQPISCCVWTEFLTLIAIQRFALTPDKDGYFTYAVWHTPLPVVAASVVVRGLVLQTAGAIGRFRLAGRDNEGRYKAFQQATLTEWRSP